MIRSIIIGAVGACLAAHSAQGQGLAIAPTTIDVDPVRRSGVVKVENNDGEPVDLQVRAFTWEQGANGQDQLTPTDEVIVSPAIVSVAGKGKQVFRLVLSGPVSSDEQSYRLLLTQLPRSSVGAIGIAIEFSIPLFVGPPERTAELHVVDKQGSVILRNDGNRRVRITSLELKTASTEVVALPLAGARYVLAHSQISVALPVASARLAGAHLVGTSDAGLIDVAVPTLLAQR